MYSIEQVKLEKHQLERNLELEKIFNIELSFNAYFEVRFGRKFIFIVGEFFGGNLETDILISAYVKDISGRIIGKNVVRIESEKFEGISSIKFQIPISDENIALNNMVKNLRIKVCPILEFMNHPSYELGILPVVGITIPERKSFVKMSKVGDELKLLLDPNNPYDNNAIKVVDAYGNLLGFIAKEWALLLSKIHNLNVILSSNATLIEKKPKVLYIKLRSNDELKNLLQI